MLIKTGTTFAIRCVRCGKMEVASVSRFELGRGRSVRVSCSCGSQMLTVSKKHGQVALQVSCYLCDGLHFVYLSPGRFWGDEVRQISCSDTELQLGVFGSDEEVRGYANPWGSELDLILEDEAFDEYFDHRDVMCQALDRVQNLAEEGNLQCTCGNRKIGIDIYPDRLELNCSECSRNKSLAAGNQEDLATLMHLMHIEVGDDPPTRRKGHKK